MSDRLKQIIRDFHAPIAVLGDYMLDEYIFGSVNRISPESPVPVVEFAANTSTLGGAGNVAANIYALGGRPVPFGFVGDDDAGRNILDILGRKLSADAANMLVDTSRPTTVKRRIIAHHQQLLRIDHESREAASASLHDRLLDGLRQSATGIGAIVVSDYNKGAITRSFFESVLQLALAHSIPIVLDPKVFDLTALGRVTVITPNEKEAEQLSGIRITGDAAAEEAGARLLEKTGACHILITRGEHGMSLFTAGAAPLHVRAQARDVFDVTGAGDTVISVLSLALAAGASVSEATELANLAAGVVVGKVGTAIVSPEELESALDGVWPAGKASFRPRINAD